MDSFLNEIESEVKKDFIRTNRILTFDDYIELVKSNSRLHTRGSARYIIDMIDSFGLTSTSEDTKKSHFRVFDMDFEDPRYKVIGQVEVQHEIYRTLKNFIKEGINNKLLLLHGPNGSAKSSIVNCIIRGLCKYSEQPEGALYRFNWIFPQDKFLKGTLGLGSYSQRSSNLDSYAKISEEEIAAKIVCELKDHPLLLIPAHSRKRFFQQVLKSDSINLSDYLMHGSLCHKCKQIFEALLTAYKGDLKKVLMHVQVERFYMSKRYRTGVVTIEPQMHVDAVSRQITIDKSLGMLPASLQSLSLYELGGDLVDANRGLVEYADLLKRPVDTFKYLLIVCESGSVNVGSTIAFLDSVFIGSTNELQMDAFKEFPDFTSFKARIELVRVPYLLEYSEEQKIYDLNLSKISGQKHTTPHTTFVCALWAVLTRLKKPNAIHYPPQLTNLVSALTPIEKARLYDHSEMPANLTPEERKVLRSAITKLREEYTNIPNYEGRIGASAREMKSILYDAAHNNEFYCLSPLAALKEIEDFVKHITEYEFLKQDIKDGYHDNFAFISIVKNEYLNILNQEVRESMGIFQSTQYQDFIKKYIFHLSHLLKKEKIQNPITGKMEPPDLNLIEEFENIIDAPKASNERETFRQNVISSIGAYALDHPNQPISYTNAFPDFMQKLEDHYFNEQRAQMMKLRDAILLFGTEKEDPTSEHHQLAKRTIQAMIDKFKYCDHCSEQAISFLVKARY